MLRYLRRPLMFVAVVGAAVWLSNLDQDEAPSSRVETSTHARPQPKHAARTVPHR